MSYLDVREPESNRLLFRYDPERELIEIKRRRVVTVVDLRQYGKQADMVGPAVAGQGRDGSQESDE